MTQTRVDDGSRQRWTALVTIESLLERSRFRARDAMRWQHRWCLKEKVFKNLSDVLWEAIFKGQFLLLYHGLGTKNLQSFIAQFVYFYGYSYFKRLYLEKSGSKSIGTKANLIVPLDIASSRMQTSAFGKSKGQWKDSYRGHLENEIDICMYLQYTMFDQLKQRLLKEKHKTREKSSSLETLFGFSAFVLGVVSKSIATFLTYPAIRCLLVVLNSYDIMIQSANSEDNAEAKNLDQTLLCMCKNEMIKGHLPWH
ncbi:hypothetical protein UlMin_042080 [Ulmus minor]